jgi:hypothetical protein
MISKELPWLCFYIELRRFDGGIVLSPQLSSSGPNFASILSRWDQVNRSLSVVFSYSLLKVSLKNLTNGSSS